MKLVTA